MVEDFLVTLRGHIRGIRAYIDARRNAVPYIYELSIHEHVVIFWTRDGLKASVWDWHEQAVRDASYRRYKALHFRID